LESRIEEADAALRPIESSRASDPSVLLLRGEILFQLGSYDESAKILRKAVADWSPAGSGAERRTGDA
jgi:tetratricopeptide (TPR) repeat protein